MKNTVIAVTTVIALLAVSASAGGISVDAGLTPAQNRLILRTQLRSMSRAAPDDQNRSMQMFAVPLVVAYGLRPDLTIMTRGIVMRRTMEMMGNRKTEFGLADLMVMGKYRVFRKNTRYYSLGLAATVGLEIPVSEKPFGSETWDVTTGLFSSLRMDEWAIDVDTRYVTNGIGSLGKDKPPDQVSVNGAVAYQVPLASSGRYALAPVAEIGYEAQLTEGEQNGFVAQDVVWLSPGAKLTVSNLILEGLVRIPVWQNVSGGMKHRVGFLTGVRYMF